MEVKQVKFLPSGEEVYQGGIMVDNTYIICGCCGGVFEMEEVEKYETLPWINISEEIKGE